MIGTITERWWLIGLVALALAMVAWFGGVRETPTAFADSGKILVYSGEGALNEGYVKFGAAAVKPVDTLGALPQDLSRYDCIVLPINGNNAPAFSAATLTALNGYVNGGGRIIALAEWAPFAGSIVAMNGLATALGADLAVVSASIDLGFNTTLNIDASPFTVGVNSIRYAATSEVAVTVGPDAHSLVRSIGGTTFIGVDRIGSGVFVLSGDSNVFSDNSANGYPNHDNGVLVRNICDGASFDIEVDIDIKPNSVPSSFGCNSKGSVPVAVLGSPTFDATAIDADTVRFGKVGDEAAEVHQKKGSAKPHVEDFNGDGDLDMIFHFRLVDTGFSCSDIPAGDKSADVTGNLTGKLDDGTDIVGQGTLHLVGK